MKGFSGLGNLVSIKKEGILKMLPFCTASSFTKNNLRNPLIRQIRDSDPFQLSV